MLRDLGASPLAEGRGLKHSRVEGQHGQAVSPLAEGRGLKPAAWSDRPPAHGSPLAEGRGLKQACARLALDSGWVAPRRGAWIETTSWPGRASSPCRRPSQRGVD